MTSVAQGPASQAMTDRAALAAAAGQGFASFVDHWMFVIMAGLFVLTALVGFIPSSLYLLSQVDAAAHAPLHPVRPGASRLSDLALAFLRHGHPAESRRAPA